MSHTDGAPTTHIYSTPSSGGDEPLVQVIRGDCVENVHRGSIAVADVAGRVVAGIGDVWKGAFLRSGAKPFQVMPAILSGGIERFGITERELAVLCSSHSGEPRHLEAVLSVLSKIGLDESALRCGVHAPVNPRAAAARWRLGLEPSPVCNNCSGAHTGMLVACVAMGWPTADYGEPEHPLQREIRHIVTEFSGADAGELEEAVDNCAVPTFRLPLVRSATAFARLATGAGVPLGPAGAAGIVRRAMTAYPEMVAGEDRWDSELMRVGAGDLVAKGGADGFQGIGSASRGIGLAVKIADGAGPATAAASLQALADRALISPGAREILLPFAEPALHNMRGAVVGRIESKFHVTEY